MLLFLKFFVFAYYSIIESEHGGFVGMISDVWCMNRIFLL